MDLPPDPALDADIAALRRHHALMVVSEEALELAHLEGKAPIDFGALDRALAEAKAWDAKLRAPVPDIPTPETRPDWRDPWSAFAAGC